jgi:hypothetical protein
MLLGGKTTTLPKLWSRRAKPMHFMRPTDDWWVPPAAEYFDFPWGEAQVICHRVQSEELKCSVASNLPLIRLSEPHAEYSYLISIRGSYAHEHRHLQNCDLAQSNPHTTGAAIKDDGMTKNSDSSKTNFQTTVAEVNFLLAEASLPY